jgi:hypothetical protein
MVVCPTPVSAPSRRRGVTLLAGLGLSLVLAACGSSDDTLSGTAATGAPIVGGTVDVKCKTGAALSATTSDAGAWSVTLGGQTLPCKVRVRGGNVPQGDGSSQANTSDYHSVAAAPGTVNITPLTDLAVAQLAKEAPSAWFGKVAAADFTTIDAMKVAAAVTAVVDALGIKDFLGTDNPLTTAFVAKVNATDKIDQALEALKRAGSHTAILEAAMSAASAADLTSAAAAFKSAVMAALPVSGGGGDAGGGGSGSGGGSSAGILACTDTEIMTLSKGAVRSPTADELAGYFKGYTGSFDHAGDNSYPDATATFNADGTVAVSWSGGQETYTGTSFCYDTTVGSIEYGNTLYVKFGDTGKVDLWKKNGKFSGWMKAESGNPSTGPSATTGLEVIASLNQQACTLPAGSGGCGPGVLTDFSLDAGQCVISKVGSSITVTKAGSSVAAVTLGGDDNLTDKAVFSGNSFVLAVREIAGASASSLSLTLNKDTGAVTSADGFSDLVPFNCF